MMKLTQNLKKLLLNHRLSENELARRTGVAQQVINRILSGQNKNPTIATLVPLAHYFSVSLSQLLGEGDTICSSDLHYLEKQSVPLLSWETCQERILKTKLEHDLFALQMNNKKLEPFIPENALLIFKQSKKPKDRDLAIVYLHHSKKIIFNRLFLDDGHFFVKLEGPSLEAQLVQLKPTVDKIMGVLIEVRMQF